VADVNRNPAPVEAAIPGGDAAGAWPVVEIAAFVVGLAAYLYVVGSLTNMVRLTAARLPIDVISAFSAGRVLGDGLRSTALTAVVFVALCVLAYLTSARRWEVNGQDWHDLVREKGVRKAAGAEHAKENRVARENAAKKRREARRAHAKGPLGGLRKPGEPSDAAESASNEAAPQEPEPIPEPLKPDPAQIGEAGVRIVAGFNILVIAGVLASAIAVGVDELVIQDWWAVLPVWALC
jgi:hypothetical protein